MENTNKWLEILGLVFVLVLGIILYFFNLEKIPSGLYVDEAESGYNAYSILKTGKDEYGKEFPGAFRFLGSYSPPLYTYLTVPFVAVFDLNVFSTRFVSALSGVFGILIVYLFLKYCRLKFRSPTTLLIGTLLFAISPWNLLFSRAGYETSVGSFLFSLSLLLIWLGLNSPKFLTLGLIMLSFSTYGYHTQKILAPIILFGIFVLFPQKIFLKKNLRFLFLGIVSAVIIQIPNLLIINTPAFFTKSELFYAQDIMIQADKIGTLLPPLISYILSSVREFSARYFTYFSLRSLFYLPDPDLQRSIPELSVLYFWMVIPFLVGVYYLSKNFKNSFVKFIVMLLILIPIPAALTKDPFSTQRSLPLLTIFIIVISIGFDQLSYKIKNIFLLPVLLLLILFSLLMLWRSYFIFLPKERAAAWGYGFFQLGDYIQKNPNRKFLIDQERIKPAHIQLAFFLKLPPEKLQQASDPSVKLNYYSNILFDSRYKFANIETGKINWEEDIYEDQIIVGDRLSISDEQANEHSLKKIYEIKDQLEQIIFVGFETNPKQKCISSNSQSRFCR